MGSVWRKYVRREFIQMRPYIPGELLPATIHIGQEDLRTGSPRGGDMIAEDLRCQWQWLVNKDRFRQDYELAGDEG